MHYLLIYDVVADYTTARAGDNPSLRVDPATL